MLSGKTLLIIVTVMASAAGFTLGYFVGQNVSAPSATSLPGPQANDITPAANLQSPNADIKTEAQVPGGTSEPGLSAEEKQASATPVSHGTPIPPSAPAKTDDNADNVRLHPGQAVDQAESAESNASARKKLAYTVQASAFKRQKDAEALKQSLEAKGYKVSIKKEANSKGAVFFKVRVGEYEKKKEASVVALRLNKTEGLNAFATSKK